MNRSRAIGYSPLAIVSAVGSTQPAPPSTCERLDDVEVLLDEREADPAERGRVGGDALDDHVVVGAGGVVGAHVRVLDAERLADGRDDEFDEAVERARLLARGGDREVGIGVRGVDGAEIGHGGGDLVGGGGGIGPVVDAGGVGAEQGVEVDEAEAGDRLVLGGGDDGQPVDGDLELDELDAGGVAGLGFLGLDGREASADVDLAGAELGEAVAGARAVDGDGDVGVGRRRTRRRRQRRSARPSTSRTRRSIRTPTHLRRVPSCRPVPEPSRPVRRLAGWCRGSGRSVSRRLSSSLPQAAATRVSAIAPAKMRRLEVFTI